MVLEYRTGRFHWYIYGQTADVVKDQTLLIVLFNKALHDSTFENSENNPQDIREEADMDCSQPMLPTLALEIETETD